MPPPTPTPEKFFLPPSRPCPSPPITYKFLLRHPYKHLTHRGEGVQGWGVSSLREKTERETETERESLLARSLGLIAPTRVCDNESGLHHGRSGGEGGECQAAQGKGRGFSSSRVPCMSWAAMMRGWGTSGYGDHAARAPFRSHCERHTKDQTRTHTQVFAQPRVLSYPLPLGTPGHFRERPDPHEFP